MLVHTVLVTDQTSLGRKLRRLLDQPDVLLTVRDAHEDLWEVLAGEPCDFLVLDHDCLPEAATGVVTTIRKLPERPEIVVLNAQEDSKERAALLAAGCLAVVNRSLPDSVLGPMFQTLVARRRDALRSRLGVEQREPQSHRLSDFASASSAMHSLLDLARRVVPSDSSLLITGETGVGKEWLGRAIHSEGRRSAAPFIAINCAAVPDSLLESELFGHEKGAFTGAARTRRGYFELAHRGTLFLDEIADTSPHLQAKLLRVLQEKRIRRLGGEQAIEVDVRVMAATNRLLEQAMAKGEFRRDLFYRLGVVTLHVPPLRERQEDIPDLAASYLERYRLQLGRPVTSISQEAVAALVAYPWPGNVRELINVMERSVLLCRGEEITTADLPKVVADAGGEFGASAVRMPAVLDREDGWLDRNLADVRKEALAWIERRYLERQLAQFSGRIGETARAAGITPRSLYSRMKLLGLRKEDFRPSG